MSPGLYDITPLEPLIEGGCLLLTPNYRLARRIKAEWDARCAAKGMQVWQPLPVQPLESWLLAQWEQAVNLGLVPSLTPLNSTQTLELWRQVIAQQQSQADDYQLLPPIAVADLAHLARDTLRLWKVDMRNRSNRQSFLLDRDCGTFLQWMTLFEQRLAAAGQCTVVDCLAQLPGLSGRLPAVPVALVEYDEIAPLMRTALEALSNGICAIRPETAPGDRLVHSFSDQRTELQTVARWAASLHRASPAATIGIVLSDMGADRFSLEYLLRREFDCLGEHYTRLPVNFSTGINLAQAPLVRDALAALSMGLTRTTVPAVVHLLRSRFLDLPDGQGALSQRFVTSLYNQGRESVEISDLRYAALEAQQGEAQGLSLGRHLLAMSRLVELRRDALPSHWVERFSAVLSLWGWPGNQTLDSLEYQQLELWHQTLDEFRGLDAVCVAINFSDALRLLTESCRRRVSQPQTVDRPVQVLGALEAAGLAFDHLWLCGMQGASWPASPRPNPFIPVALQTQLQMPHATSEREWAYGAALLDQYARSSGTLHASYSRQIDGIPDLASPMLQDFTPQHLSAASLVAPLWTLRREEGALEHVLDSTAPSLSLEQQTSLRGGSALLEEQSQCPFRGFARRRLLVEPLSEFSIVLSSAERGSLLHAALFALWGELGDHATLLAQTEHQEHQVVEWAVQTAIDAIPHFRRRQLGAAYWQLEGQRLSALLHEWLTVERQRSQFTVAQRELDITVELAQLQIRLRVDRIDQLPDGSQVIIDYKSGRSTVRDWLGERPAKPQLLLYGIAVPDTAGALAFAQVRPRECSYVGLGRVAAAPGISTDIARADKSHLQADDWPSLNARWRENLERLAQTFVAGDARVDPLTPASCKWCGLQPLCRVEMSGATFEAEET